MNNKQEGTTDHPGVVEGQPKMMMSDAFVTVTLIGAQIGGGLGG